MIAFRRSVADCTTAPELLRTTLARLSMESLAVDGFLGSQHVLCYTLFLISPWISSEVSQF